MMNKAKTVKLTIYLVKDKSAKHSSIIELGGAEEPVSLELAGGNCSLYIKKQKDNPPQWASLLTSTGQVSNAQIGFSKSTGAALVINLPEATFLVTLGQGFHLMNDESIERDFGLRVALNSIAPEDIHSLDKATNERTPLSSRTQSGLGVDLYEMLVDPDKDLLYAITGKSTEGTFGSSVTGRDSFQINVKSSLSDLPNILRKALVYYGTPLPNDFKWVDNVRKIKDPSLITDLNDELVSHINFKNFSKIALIEPEIVDFSQVDGYSFAGNQKAARYQFLSIDKYYDFLTTKKTTIDIEDIRGSSIYVRNALHETQMTWSGFRCLAAEITVNGKTYILRNAIWYKVDDNFVKTIDLEVAQIPLYSGTLPQFNHSDEGDYNESVSKTHGFDLMDKKLIPLGTGSSRVEFCDLIKDEFTLIHVKKYSGSSTLSHLFSQGLVSAEAFKKSEQFRVDLNKKLPPFISLQDTSVTPDSTKYEIVYAIYTDKILPDELPFFSKITLKNAYQSLRAMNYNVSIAKIDINNGSKLLGKGKPQKPPKKRVA